METCIGVIVAGLGAGAVYVVKKLGASIFLSKFGPAIQKTFDIIDPIDIG